MFFSSVVDDRAASYEEASLAGLVEEKKKTALVGFRARSESPTKRSTAV